MQTTNETKYYEIKLEIFAGTNTRKAVSKEAMRQMGFNESSFEVVKAMLQTSILPSDALKPFLAIRKTTQEFLDARGVNHGLLGRLFNPQERLEIMDFLNQKKDEYEEAKKTFLAEYQGYLDIQVEIAGNSARLQGVDPDPIVKALVDRQPTARYWASKMKFRFVDNAVILDHEEWSDLVEEINANIESKTAYQLGVDIEDILEKVNPLSRVKSTIEASRKLTSLSFYVGTAKEISDGLDEIITKAGSVKPAKEYSQEETLFLIRGLKTVQENAKALVFGQVSINELISISEKDTNEILGSDAQLLEAVSEELNSHQEDKSVSKGNLGRFNF